MKYFCCLIALLFSLTIRAQKISRQQAIDDIDYFNSGLKELHYTPFLYITQEAYQKKTDSIKNSLSDSVELNAFILKLYKLSAFTGDGHTMPALIQPTLKNDFRKQIFFPLELVADDNSNVFVPDQPDLKSIPKGAELVAVNHIVIKPFYKDACTLTAGLPAYRKEIAVKLLGYYLYLAGISPPFKISYRYQNHLQETVINDGIIFKLNLAKAFPHINGQPYSFKVMGEKIGYIDLVTLGDDYKKYGAFFDSCFTIAKSKNLKAVAIDLRKNTGGNSIIADLLISYFNTNPYAISGGRYWRVSKRYKEYLQKQNNTGSNYLKQPDNTVWDNTHCGAQTPMFVDNTNLYKGKVYIITGPTTFSSANMLADGVKQYKMATLIGEPTGENTSDFGEGYKFELPYSKVTMQVSTSFDIGADCDAKKLHPVVPDILIKTGVADKINRTDPVLERILKDVNR